MSSRENRNSLFKNSIRWTDTKTMPLFLACWQNKEKVNKKMKVSRLDRPVLSLSALAEVQCTMQCMWAVTESRANVSGAVHSPVTQILQMRNVVKEEKKKKWCIKVAVHTRSAGWWVNYAEEKNLSSVRPVTTAMNEVMGYFFKFWNLGWNYLISGLIMIYYAILKGYISYMCTVCICL